MLANAVSLLSLAITPTALLQLRLLPLLHLSLLILHDPLLLKPLRLLQRCHDTLIEVAVSTLSVMGAFVSMLESRLSEGPLVPAAVTDVFGVLEAVVEDLADFGMVGRPVGWIRAIIKTVNGIVLETGALRGQGRSRGTYCSV